MGCDRFITQIFNNIVPLLTDSVPLQILRCRFFCAVNGNKKEHDRRKGNAQAYKIQSNWRTTMRQAKKGGARWDEPLRPRAIEGARKTRENIYSGMYSRTSIYSVDDVMKPTNKRTQSIQPLQNDKTFTPPKK